MHAVGRERDGLAIRSHGGVSVKCAAGYEQAMYIGIGAVVLILLILLIIYFARRA